MQDHNIDPAAGAKRVAEKLSDTCRDVLEELAGGTLDESVCGVGGKTTMATEKLYPQVFGELLRGCEVVWLASETFRCALVPRCEKPYEVPPPCPIAEAEAGDPVTALGMLALQIAAQGNLVELIVGMAKEAEEVATSVVGSGRFAWYNADAAIHSDVYHKLRGRLPCDAEGRTVCGVRVAGSLWELGDEPPADLVPCGSCESYPDSWPRPAEVIDTRAPGNDTPIPDIGDRWKPATSDPDPTSTGGGGGGDATA